MLGNRTKNARCSVPKPALLLTVARFNDEIQAGNTTQQNPSDPLAVTKHVDGRDIYVIPSKYMPTDWIDTTDKDAHYIKSLTQYYHKEESSGKDISLPLAELKELLLLATPPLKAEYDR